MFVNKAFTSAHLSRLQTLKENKNLFDILVRNNCSQGKIYLFYITTLMLKVKLQQNIKTLKIYVFLIKYVLGNMFLMR